MAHAHLGHGPRLCACATVNLELNSAGLITAARRTRGRGMRSRSVVPATLTRVDARGASEKLGSREQVDQAGRLIKQAEQQHFIRRQSQVAPTPVYLPNEELVCPSCQRPYNMNE